MSLRAAFILVALCVGFAGTNLYLLTAMANRVRECRGSPVQYDPAVVNPFFHAASVPTPAQLKQV